jgi:hypothetical protein
LGGLGLHVLIGIGQFWQRGPLGLPGELSLPADQTGAAVLSAGGIRWLRIYGLTFHPNVLGGFLAVGLILGLPFLVNKWMRFLWGLLAFGLLLTFSRSAWISIVIVLPVTVGWLVWRKPALRGPLWITLGSMALAGFLGIFFLKDYLAGLIVKTSKTYSVNDILAYESHEGKITAFWCTCLSAAVLSHRFFLAGQLPVEFNLP